MVKLSTCIDLAGFWRIIKHFCPSLRQEFLYFKSKLHLEALAECHTDLRLDWTWGQGYNLDLHSFWLFIFKANNIFSLKAILLKLTAWESNFSEISIFKFCFWASILMALYAMLSLYLFLLYISVQSYSFSSACLLMPGIILGPGNWVLNGV